MNQIANRPTSAVAALSALKSGLQNVQSTLVSRGGDPFMRLGRDGKWIFGAENIEVVPGDLWAANPLSLMHGWVAWDRSEKGDTSNGPLGESMVPLSMPIPAKATLPDVGFDYEFQLAITLMGVAGDDKGEQVLYKTASAGGVRAMEGLIKDISNHIDADPDNPVPVLALETDSYNHKKYGKTYFPVLVIKTWLPLEGDLPNLDATGAALKPADPIVEPEKARTRKASVPATPAKAAEPPKAKALEDMTEEELEAHILAKRQAKAAPPVEKSAADIRKEELRAQLAALDADEGPAEPTAPAETAPAAGQPLRRRRA